MRDGRSRSQALPCPGDAVREVARVGCGSRGDEGPTADRARHGGSTRAAGRDPRGSTSLRRVGCRRDDPPDAPARCRPRRIPEGSRARVARRRGAADAPSPASDHHDTGVPGRARSDDLALRRAVAGSRSPSDGQGTLRPSATRASRPVPAGSASDFWNAAPRRAVCLQPASCEAAARDAGFPDFRWVDPRLAPSEQGVRNGTTSWPRAPDRPCRMATARKPESLRSGSRVNVSAWDAYGPGGQVQDLSQRESALPGSAISPSEVYQYASHPDAGRPANSIKFSG